MTRSFFFIRLTRAREAFLFLLLLTIMSAGTSLAAILELSGPAGATVSLNGRPRGFFPLEHPLDLGPGTYVIECTLPGHKDYSSEVFLADESAWKRVHVRLTPYSRNTAAMSNFLLAGLGQHYLDKPAKGWFFNIAEAGGLVTALVAEAGRVNSKEDYLLLKDKYDAAFNTDDLENYRQLTEQAYADMQDYEKLRDTGLMVAGGAIVLSIIDAMIFFPSVEAGPGPGPSPLGQEGLGALGSSGAGTGDYFHTVHAGIKLAF